MTWTRRQFGLWTAATLLAPEALAGPMPQQQQLVESPPVDKPLKGLKALALSLVVDSRTARDVTYNLVGHNRGKKGVAVRLTNVRSLDTSNQHVLAWFNNDHPMSRMLGIPPFVDVPVGGPLVLAQIHLGYGFEGGDKPLVLPDAVEVTVSMGKQSRDYRMTLADAAQS